MNVDEKGLHAQRFNSDDSIHIGIDVAGYPAFFVMTSDIYASTLQMARDDKEILRLQGSLPVKAIKQFAVKNLVDEMVITNPSRTRPRTPCGLQSLFYFSGCDNDRGIRKACSRYVG